MWTKDNSITDLIDGVYNHGPSILQWASTNDDISKYVDRVLNDRLHYPIPVNHPNRDAWFIPQKYKEFDVEAYCLEQCTTAEETERVNIELALYKEHNMIPILQCMKYIVDTLRENKVMWGVGRGSSVASYCLFLLGVHKIDSIKYDIPLNEFFK